MAEHKSKLQSNINWLETFKMGRKAPAIADRIFNTLKEAQDFVDDLGSNATQGIRITVLTDEVYGMDANGKEYGEPGYIETIVNERGVSGVYYVESLGDGHGVHGRLVKIWRGTCAWFVGNVVKIDGQLNARPTVRRAEVGDMYLNSDTLDVYTLLSNNTWHKFANLVPQPVDIYKCYYIVDTQNTTPPQFNTTDWKESVSDAKQVAGVTQDTTGQRYLWTRLYTVDQNNEIYPKYTCSMIHSSLNLGMFTI